MANEPFITRFFYLEINRYNHVDSSDDDALICVAFCSEKKDRKRERKNRKVNKTKKTKKEKKEKKKEGKKEGKKESGK
uniref:Uncharacterized protein n=1 Tax=Vespula pensylvanica TaxID=30213 RepID=A0A834KS26_VESPE|nr:hypothetical protein H0235_013978 [Vespula pensylvanica]